MLNRQLFHSTSLNAIFISNSRVLPRLRRETHWRQLVNPRVNRRDISVMNFRWSTCPLTDPTKTVVLLCLDHEANATDGKTIKIKIYIVKQAISISLDKKRAGTRHYCNIMELDGGANNWFYREKQAMCYIFACCSIWQK